MKLYIKNNFSKLLFGDIASNGEKAWFCNINFNALFEIDIQTMKIKFLSVLPAEKESMFNSYSAIAYYNNKLIIAPRNEHRILVFDVTGNQIEKEINVDLSIMGENNKSFNLFSKIEIVGEYAYILPGRYPAILKLSLLDYSIEIIDAWYKECKSAIVDSNRTIFSTATLQRNRIILPFWQVGRIMFFNIEDEKWDIVQVKKLDQFLGGVAEYKGKVYIASSIKNSLFEIDNSEIREWITFENIDGIGEGILRICVVGNELLVFPSKGKNILSVDLETKEISVSTDCSNILLEEQKKNAYVDSQFLCAKVFGDIVIAYSLYEGYIYVYSKSCDEWKKESIILPENIEDEVEKLVEGFYMKNFMCEKTCDEFEEWIDWIIDK